MKVTSVRVHKELKLSRNFNSAGSGLELTVSLEEGEDWQDAKEVLGKQIEDHIEEDIRKLVRVLP